MIHLVDPPRLVAALAPFFERRLASDEGRAVDAVVFISAAAGAWRLQIKDGKVSCTTLEQWVPDCIELPRWQFTQLLAGYRGVNELDADLSPAQQETLGMILPKTWPYSLSDPDLWSDVAPPRPYTAAGARVVEATTLPWLA